MPEQHAVLSASSADRWLHCPGSVSLTKGLPDSTSTYAQEGRLAHAIGEWKLTKYFKEGVGPKTFTTRLNKLKKDPCYQGEMDHHTDSYLDYVKELAMSLPAAPFVAIEKRVDFSAFVPEGFGTADCILIQGNNLHIIDFKYGSGVLVEAEGNPQMMLYAVGALLEYRMLYDIHTVHMAIVQPRGGGIKESKVDRDTLINWATMEVRPIAKQAFEGTEELHSGDWCRWCKVKATCRTRAEDVTSAVEEFGGRLPPLLSDEEVGLLLARVDPLVAYANAIRDYAQDLILAGGSIPGWKLVEGRSARSWDDQKEAFKDLKAAGIAEALLYERKPLTAPALEKVLGVKQFSEVANSHVVKTPGKPTLAPESDSRTPYSPRPTAQEDFGQINTETVN